MNEAFTTELLLFQGPVGVFRGRVGALYLPSNLSEIVTACSDWTNARRQEVISDDTRHSRKRPIYRTRRLGIATVQLSDGGTGTGQTVAIIELGGGFSATDLQTYFSGEGLILCPA